MCDWEFGDCDNMMLIDNAVDEVSFDRLEWLRTKIFCLDEIFSIILQNLTVPDLLQCSLVSTTWLIKCRKILRDKKSCLAAIHDTETCMTLQCLDQLLQNSDAIPFNGLSIQADFFRRNGKPCIKNQKPKVLYPTLTSLKVKHLKLNYNEFPRCPAGRLIQTILQEQSFNLKTLEILVPFRLSSLLNRFHIQKPKHPYWLPNLSRFQLELPPNSDFYPLMSEILDAAPNLKAITGSITPEKLEFLIQAGQVSNLKELRLVPMSLSHLEISSNLALAGPQLRKLFVSTAEFGFDFNNEIYLRFLNILQVLIINCCKSLEEFSADRNDLILFNRAIFALSKETSVSSPDVKDHEASKDHFIELLNHNQLYSFSRSHFQSSGTTSGNSLFPNLYFVELYSHEPLNSKGLTHLVEHQTNGFPSVRKLKIHREFQLSCLTTLFPNVTDFELASVLSSECFALELWSSWSFLERLTLNIDLAIINAEAIFIGISTDELRWLKTLPIDLCSVFLVPSVQSLSNLKNLKTLRLLLIKSYKPVDHTFGNCSCLECGFVRIIRTRMSNVRIWINRRN